MKRLLQKLYYGSLVTAALVVLGYSFRLYANWQLDGLQALFLVAMSLLALLWFGFLLYESADDWPLSIRYVKPAALPLREHRVEWKRLVQQSA